MMSSSCYNSLLCIPQDLFTLIWAAPYHAIGAIRRRHTAVLSAQHVSLLLVAWMPMAVAWVFAEQPSGPGDCSTFRQKHVSYCHQGPSAQILEVSGVKLPGHAFHGFAGFEPSIATLWVEEPQLIANSATTC